MKLHIKFKVLLVPYTNGHVLLSAATVLCRQTGTFVLCLYGLPCIKLGLQGSPR
jgi:hypothetical protein